MQSTIEGGGRVNSTSRKVFLRGLPYNISAAGGTLAIARLFAKHPGFQLVENINVSKGFAVILFDSPESAALAVELYGDGHVNIGPRKVFLTIFEPRGRGDYNRGGRAVEPQNGTEQVKRVQSEVPVESQNGTVETQANAARCENCAMCLSNMSDECKGKVFALDDNATLLALDTDSTSQIVTDLKLGLEDSAALGQCVIVAPVSHWPQARLEWFNSGFLLAVLEKCLERRDISSRGDSTPGVEYLGFASSAELSFHGRMVITEMPTTDSDIKQLVGHIISELAIPGVNLEVHQEEDAMHVSEFLPRGDATHGYLVLFVPSHRCGSGHTAKRARKAEYVPGNSFSMRSLIVKYPARNPEVPALIIRRTLSALSPSSDSNSS